MSEVNIAFIMSIIGWIVLIYIVYKLSSYLLNKSKEKYDNSVIGMSMKIKKEKLKRELEDLEKKNNE